MMVPAASLVRKKNRVGFSNCAVTAVKVDTLQRLEPLSSIIVWCVLDEEKKKLQRREKKKLSHGLRRNISLGRSLIINECIRRRNASKNKTKQKTGWPTLSKQNILQTSQKLLLLLAFVFVTTASIASRISSGEGGEREGRKKTKSKKQHEQAASEIFGSSWRRRSGLWTAKRGVFSPASSPPCARGPGIEAQSH